MSNTDTALAPRRDRRGHNAASKPGEVGFQAVRLPETNSGINHAARDEFASAHRGILDMDLIERDTLDAMVAGDLIEVMESLPANTPDFPGPLNSNNSEIAVNALTLHANLSSTDEVDWEGSTGSWGTRKPGEGAVAYEAVKSEWSNHENMAVEIETVRGTMTWEELTSGDIPVEAEGEDGVVTWTFDVDFKRLVEEKDQSALGESYLDTLHDVADARRLEGYTKDMLARVDAATVGANYAQREFVRWLAKDRYKFPLVEPDDPRFREVALARYKDAHSVPLGVLNSGVGAERAATHEAMIAQWYDTVFPLVKPVLNDMR
ncbi:hypothetical protein [Aeromicrobium sp. 179-A 4D2 NHS]|uniref:hypothetical protein n=1 Tax=Aeromicrobium sp. 179-A 4D2 NHS TaxID=3142375 RepID=UPI00399F1A3E